MLAQQREQLMTGDFPNQPYRAVADAKFLPWPIVAPSCNFESVVSLKVRLQPLSQVTRDADVNQPIGAIDHAVDACVRRAECPQLPPQYSSIARQIERFDWSPSR
jgi:hypothetical protein